MSYINRVAVIEKKDNIESNTLIHPTAIIDPLADVGPGVSIGAYSIIEGKVSIGANTVIGHHAHIKGPTTIGENNTISSFASIGCDPQDKKYDGEETYLVIGNNNSIREYVTISRGTSQGGYFTKIGDHNLLMAYVHVAHDCIIGNHNVLANGASLAGHVELGNYVGMGGFSGVHQFTQVGSFAFCAGGSIITKDVPPFTLISGHPAKLIGLNLEGMKRRNFSDDDRVTLKSIYKKLFRDSLNIIDDAQALLAEEENEHAKTLLHFILKSQRGLTR